MLATGQSERAASMDELPHRYPVTLKQAMSYCDTVAVLFEWASEAVPWLPA